MTTNNWIKILRHAGVKQIIAEKWAPSFAQHCQGKIYKANDVAAFLGNLMVESQYLNTLQENLNYSAQGLANTWPRRFASGGKPNALARQIARKPQAIANHAYANRMGNGGPETGDGWRNRGMGPIQITGKNNKIAYSKATGSDVMKNPELLMQPHDGVRSAVWFWTTNGCSARAVAGDFDGACDLVNIGSKTRKIGDSHGYNHRKTVYNKLLTLFKNHPSLLTGKDTPATEKVSVNEYPLDVNWNDETDPLNEFPVVQDYKKL